MTNNSKINLLDSRSQKLRKICIQIGKEGGENASHIGGALSCVDFMVGADDIFHYSSSAERLKSLVLSKGHACLSLYSLMIEAGIVNEEQVKSTFEKNNSKFLGHPCRNLELGISFSTGSLGNGLAHSAGKALKRMNNKKESNIPVTCIVGDGECNEGIIWETLEFINQQKISNLIIFVDCNKWQQTQKSIYSLDDYKSFTKRLSSFNNIDLFQINGNNHIEIRNALDKKTEFTKIIVGKTIKGKGFNLFEDDNKWHHGVVTQAIYDQIC